MRDTYLRIWQLFTGVAVAILLGIHIVMLHLTRIFGASAADLTSWESMLGRARQGTLATLYIALLAFGLYHGLYGLRGIILELSPSPTTMRVINWVIIVLGIIVFIGGTYVPIALLSS